MLYIDCPWCGKRNETEFHYGGEAHIARPEDPSALSDEQWADFLFMRKNLKGPYAERWCHSNGCRRWFNVIRNTVSHEILAVYKMGETPPDLGPKKGEGV
ncbi:MAG: sarcosine oxidase subunit delta family protein [Alphaproteobacteria bacterium]|nr:MAG: sarcosine oxidase subunit delta family protein [Alphaproteobacteria bacterium]